jgi:inositol phosphorylceramide mannosyltransferase catalytic subunit
MIPKRIIQVWCGASDIPLLLKSAMVNVRLLHPTFEYILFDDAKVESFLQEHFPQYHAAYHSFRIPIQKFDFFRYLAVYHYGGFYLDLDVFLAQDLSPLLDYRCVFTFEELSRMKYLWRQYGMDWQIANYAFGAEPGHPFLAAIIENCLRARGDRSWVEPMLKGIPRLFRSQFCVLNTSGPGLVSRTYAENPRLAKDVVILFPDDVRDTREWHKFGNFGVHHMMSSWRGSQGLFSRRLQRFWFAWTERRMLSESRTRGKTRNQGSLRQAEARSATS